MIKRKGGREKHRGMGEGKKGESEGRREGRRGIGRDKEKNTER